MLEAPGRARARSWSAVDGPRADRRLLLEEIRIGDEHWVQLPALVDEGVIEQGWIRFDLADHEQRRWLEANGLGLIEHAALWRARPGDRHGDDEIVAVERRSGTERVLILASGLELEVARDELRRPPAIEPPDPQLVVPVSDLARLLGR